MLYLHLLPCTVACAQPSKQVRVLHNIQILRGCKHRGGAADLVFVVIPKPALQGRSAYLSDAAGQTLEHVVMCIAPVQASACEMSPQQFLCPVT